MSKGELLYFKGMNMSDSKRSKKHEQHSKMLGSTKFARSTSNIIPIIQPESEEESDDGDIWDDSKLTSAYDKAVSMANAEIARRVAMSTNNRSKTESKKETRQSSKSHKKNNSSHKHCDTAMQWKAGMACSAVYDVDGLEYEAFILRIINDEECVVRFLGYENSEIVAISTLKPSLGKERRARQIQEALDFTSAEAEITQENVEDFKIPTKNFATKNETMEVESDRIHSEASSGSHHRKKKSSKKKKHNRNSFEMPNNIGQGHGGFPMPMPNIADFMSSGVPEMSIPPPPVSVLGGAGAAGREQALSAMLLSWYMSGYCTGYYQGITSSKESRRNK